MVNAELRTNSKTSLQVPTISPCSSITELADLPIVVIVTPLFSGEAWYSERTSRICSDGALSFLYFAESG